jgi:coenzyme F420-0:L-glutamate ligase/coenzyme F420-1:gamma-L-glutamate ligase
MSSGGPGVGRLRVGSEVSVRALPGIPTVAPGDDLASIVGDAIDRAQWKLADGDIVVVASKVVSRAENCFVDLATLEPSPEAQRLAEEVDKDPRLVELILRESRVVSRKTTGALIVRHRLGFVSANAGIDSSNSAPIDAPNGSGPWVLTLPRDPDASARALRDSFETRFRVRLAVMLTDSWGRPFRRGTVGFALGVAGLSPVWDRRGTADRHGRVLEATISGVADSVAAAADLVAGQADEGTPVTLVRGLHFDDSNDGADALLRDPDEDLYA